MSDRLIFIDSNIWLYRFLADQDPDPNEDTRKRNIAINLTRSKEIIVSTQVINEVCFNLIRKALLDETLILNLIEEFEEHCIIVELTVTVLKNASYIRTQYSLSFWDSLIIASALAAEASILYSEDMQDGLVVGGKLEIVNPFN